MLSDDTPQIGKAKPRNRYQPDFSGNVGETTTTVKMPKRMKGAWMAYCQGQGKHHREAIRELIERELRLAYGMPLDDTKQ